MDIESITHKGLKCFFTTGNAKGLVGDAKHIRLMLISLHSAGLMEDMIAPPHVGLHVLKGERAGFWSMAVSRNWRMTFRLSDDGKLHELNLEEYRGS